MSPSPPFPSVILVSTSSIALVPRRQGTHLPHDSSWTKFMKNLANSTMQVSSSQITIPPEPIIEPSSSNDS